MQSKTIQSRGESEYIQRDESESLWLRGSLVLFFF